MDIQLQELLDKIKRDGLDAAQAETTRLVTEAEAKKKALIAEAETEAKRIIEKAKADSLLFEESAKAALVQASRDLLLSFKDRLQALLDAAVKADVDKVYGPELLAEVIPVVLKALAGGEEEKLAVLLPPALLSKLESRFSSSLAAELKRGLEIKPYPDLAAGFRVTERDGSAYYDFSAEALAELLSTHLNARLATLLREAAQGM